MSTRGSAPPLPSRLASSFGGTRWPPGHSVLRNEELPASCPPPSAYGFSFASSSGSKSQLYVSWCSGTLTRAIFSDYGGSTAASMYFAGAPSLLSLPGCRFSTSSACCSSGASSSRSSSLRASSGSRGPLCAPLVASPPRGDVSDGRVATSGVGSGPVHARQRGLVWWKCFLSLSGSVSVLSVCLSTRGGLIDPGRSKG